MMRSVGLVGRFLVFPFPVGEIFSFGILATPNTTLSLVKNNPTVDISIGEDAEEAERSARSGCLTLESQAYIHELITSFPSPLSSLDSEHVLDSPYLRRDILTCRLDARVPNIAHVRITRHTPVVR
jgi:hypothetical protein